MIKKDILNKIGTDLVNEIKFQLQKKKKIDTGNLLNSIKYKIIQTRTGWQLIIFDTDGYLQYVDAGRKPGKWPPRDKIKPWVKRKLKVEEDKIDSVSFLVARKIGEKGIAPTHIIKTALKTVLSNWKPKLRKYIYVETKNAIMQEIKDIFGNQKIINLK